MRRHKKLTHQKLWIAFIIGSILVLNCVYLYINLPDYSDLHRFSPPDLGNLIWSNQSAPILSPRDACPRGPSISGPEILVMVTSSILNFDRRSAIRNSWANTAQVRSGRIKVIFTIGEAAWSTCGVSGKEEEEEEKEDEGGREGYFKKIILHIYNF